MKKWNKKINTSCIYYLGIVLLLSGTTGFAQKEDSIDKLLLRNYRPKSIYNTPKTKIVKAKYRVIDVHAHVYAKTPKEVAQWIMSMDETGLEKTIILTQAYGPKFDSIYSLYSDYSDRFEVWCGFDYSGYDQPGFGPAAVAELERCVQFGAKGVGELGDKGMGHIFCKPMALGMHSNDPRMDPLYEKCAELNLPVSLHVAEPMWMYLPMDSTNDGLMNAYNWRIDISKDNIVNHAGMMEILNQTLQRHPKTTFIACHLANCSYDLNILGGMFDKYPNLYADISARFAETTQIPHTVAAFFEKFQDRILYGTDMSTFNPGFYRTTFRILESFDEHFYLHDYFNFHWSFNGFGLDEYTLQKLYRTNALEIMQKRDKVLSQYLKVISTD